MKILAVDSSAITASVAITEDRKIIGETYVNAGLTHSQTLMPMVQSLLKCVGIDISEIDAFAISTGPGSFTGLRIGIGAVKGMAMALDKPCIAVSTLEAIAYPFIKDNAVVCSAMDARCNQVYNALFKAENGKLLRLCDDRAISVDSLLSEISAFDKIIFAGDGAMLCEKSIGSKLKNALMPIESTLYQHASSVALLAFEKYGLIGEKALLDAARLMPVYLRPSQAEREYQAKMQKA